MLGYPPRAVGEDEGVAAVPENEVRPDQRAGAGSPRPGAEASESLESLRAEVLAAAVPTHVGIIMDGNGRWAQRRGRPRLEGHRAGARAVREITRAARKLGVRWLTLYAFSSQNWERPEDEVSGLMALLADFLLQERSEILDNGVRLDAVGDLAKLPPRVRERLERLREDSADNDELVLTLALSYGGREEILEAARRLAAAAARGEVEPGSIDEAAFRRATWSGERPDPDLVIRTGGELRLSNFLLFQSAYAELLVTETAWPDFDERELLLALREFRRRERRFGKTSEQVRVAR